MRDSECAIIILGLPAGLTSLKLSQELGLDWRNVVVIIGTASNPMLERN